MAKKQTLKSLLGGGDGRVQARLDLGTPKLQPTIGRGGQSVTTTQQTLSAEQSQLGKLATSLEKLNPKLQSMQNAYYTEAQREKLEFTEKFQGMDETERQALVQAQEANLANTETAINSQFRGQYGLNPLTGIYAEKLVGASVSTEYQKFMAKKIQEKKLEIEKLSWEDRPTAADMEGYISGLTEEYLNTGSKDGGVLFQKGSLRYEGFMAGTNSLRAKLRLETPKGFEDHHKDTVFIPNLANNLRNTALETAELEAVDGTQPNNKRAKLNTYLRYLDTLDIADTQKVLNDFVNGFAVEDADFAREALSEIGQDLKIGNEPFVGSSLYNNLLDEIEKKEDAWRTETTEHNTELFKDYTKTYFSEIRNIHKGEFDANGNHIEGTGGTDAVNQYIKEEQKKILENKDLPQEVKNSLVDWFEGESAGLETLDDRAISNLSVYLDNSTTSMNALSGDAITKEVFGEVISNQETYTDVSNPLFASVAGLTAYNLDQLATADANAILNQERDWITGEVVNLKKKAIRLNLPSAEAEADWVAEKINSKGGLREQYKERLKNKFNNYLNQQKAIEDKETALQTDVAEKAKIVTDNLNKISDPKNQLTTAGGTRGVRFQYNTTNILGLFVKDEIHIPKMIDKYSNTAQFLKDGDANLGILAEAYDEIYTQANDALPRLIKLASRKERRETVEMQKRQASQYQLIKGFAGYEPTEVIDIMESVFDDSLASDEHGIPYDTDYFKNNYKSIRIDGLEKGDEATKVLATLLGISVDSLIKSQDDYRTKFRITN